MSIDIMQKSWFMKYQPMTLDSLVFDSDEHRALMQTWVENKKVDGNVLFFGPAGLGKTTSAEILIRVIIEAQNDLYKAKEKSTKEVREVISQFVKKKPVKSNQKIVYIEEFDKLHNEAENLLKDGLMEKYQETCAFICCTNHIRKIEDAVLSRFNFKIPFSGANIDGFVERLSDILTKENATFEKDHLKEFVSQNYRAGMREMINQLQSAFISNNGEINFTDMHSNAGLEEKVIQLVFQMLQTTLSLSPQDRRLCIDQPMQSAIAEQYTSFCALLHNNYDINYDIIFDRIFERTNHIPSQSICAKYADMNEYKRFPQMNMISCFREMMLSIVEMTG